MALSHSWHIGIDVPPPPRSEQASQETIPTETIFSASLPVLVLVRVSIDEDGASPHVPAELSSLDCSSCCCANRALEVELDSSKSDVLVATDADPFFSVLREKREFAVGL